MFNVGINMLLVKINLCRLSMTDKYVLSMVFLSVLTEVNLWSQ